MAKKPAAAPPANATGADVHLMPWEKTGSETADAETSLSNAVDSLLADEQPEQDKQEAEEAQPEEAETAEVEAEAEPDETEAVAETEPEEAEPTFDIEGEQVTLSELKKRGLREADYTRKTQALAEDRKKAEAEASEYRVKREQLSTQLAQLESFIQSTLPPKPDSALRESDPVEYLAQKAAHEEAVESLQAVQAKQAEVAEEKAKEIEGLRREVIADESRKLLEKIPELKDPAKAKEIASKLATYAETTYGWTAKDLENTVDHRLLVMLNKARLYDESVAKGKDKVVVKPTLKPGGKTANVSTASKSNEDDIRAGFKQLRRSGRTEDAAALIGRLLPDL